MNKSKPRRKRLVCFLHVPKTAGSSAWHTLAYSATRSNPARFSIVDPYHEAKMLTGNSPSDRRLDRLAKCELSKFVSALPSLGVDIMFAHMHTLRLADLPEDVDVDFLVVYRSPEDRLASALRAWLGGSDVSRHTDRLRMASGISTAGIVPRIKRWIGVAAHFLGIKYLTTFPMSFFFTGDSNGLDQYLRSYFGRGWETKSSFGLRHGIRIIPFSMNATVGPDGKFARFVASEYGVDMLPMQYLELTKTDRGAFQEAQQNLRSKFRPFAAAFDRRVRSESVAIERMLTLSAASFQGIVHEPAPGKPTYLAPVAGGNPPESKVLQK